MRATAALPGGCVCALALWLSTTGAGVAQTPTQTRAQTEEKGQPRAQGQAERPTAGQAGSQTEKRVEAQAEERTESEASEQESSPDTACGPAGGVCGGAVATVGEGAGTPESTRDEQSRALADVAPARTCPYCPASSPEEEAELAALHWHHHWSRVGVVEYVTTATMAAGMLGLAFVEPADEPAWRDPILLDSWIRKGMVPDSRQAREVTGTVSDVFVYLALGQLLLVDNLIVTLGIHASPDVAWQMAIINAQSLSLTVLLNSIAKLAFRRERPYVRECADDAEYSAKCGNAWRNASFYSGHAAQTAASAGLICAHHTQLQLYASGTLDAATCIASVGLSVAAGVLRLSSDNHWASDVAVGYLMGYLAGYLMPTLLYYRDFRLVPEKRDLHRESEPARVFFMPLASSDTIGLATVGRF